MFIYSSIKNGIQQIFCLLKSLTNKFGVLLNNFLINYEKTN